MYVYNPSNFSVNHATTADNATTVGGFVINNSANPFGKIPIVGGDGVMELGKILDFHYDNTTGSDYSTRLNCTGNNSNQVNLPSVSGTLALTSDIPTLSLATSGTGNAVSSISVSGHIIT